MFKRGVVSMRLVTGVLALVVTILIAPTAEARRHGHHRPHVTNVTDNSTSSPSHFGGRRHHPTQATRHARGKVDFTRNGRPRAWCGWWLGHHLGMADRRLWLARNWAQVGQNVGQPQIGAVVVWRHHVGIITGRVGEQWIIKSGNDGRGVRERVRSIAGAIAFRRV